ncbi:MAG TPA: hypothetical protein VJR30_23245, partial [Bradyrhizobium sp.]|nr:hypothetical protein [Bradyrhizobium sp.]
GAVTAKQDRVKTPKVPLTRIASAMQHSRSSAAASFFERPPKAAYASPRKRGEVKTKMPL